MAATKSHAEPVAKSHTKLSLFTLASFTKSLEIYDGVRTTSLSLSCEKPSQEYISLNNFQVKSVVRPIL